MILSILLIRVPVCSTMSFLVLTQVAIDSCTEGIIRVSQRAKTINPMQQVEFEFQISSSLNLDLNHTCTGTSLGAFLYCLELMRVSVYG